MVQALVLNFLLLINTSEFDKADSIVSRYPKHSLGNLEILSGKLTNDLYTEEGKFRAIYRWVCLNIDNDFMLAEANKKKRARLTGNDLLEWNSKFAVMANKKLSTDHSTICTGYAWLIRELSHYTGITSEMIDGYGRMSRANIGGTGTPNHTWIAVKLNDKWYLCDPTWSSGALNMSTKEFERKYDDAYFLSSPDYFIRNHYPLDKKWTLLEQPPTLEEFLNRPLVYVGAFHNKILPKTPEQFQIIIEKDETVKFSHAGSTEQIIEMHVGSKTLHTTRHTFKRRGIYAVHFTAGGEPLFTYQVTVN